MNHTKRDIIVNLETLSKIPKNGKLKLTNNEIEIYQNNWSEWIKRWGYGDSRNNTISYLNNFFDHVILTIDDMIACIKHQNNKVECKNKADDLSFIGLSLANSIVGIGNLCETYSKDEKTNAQLRFICKQYISAQYLKIAAALELYDAQMVPKLKADIQDLVYFYSSPAQTRLRQTDENLDGKNGSDDEK